LSFDGEEQRLFLGADHRELDRSELRGQMHARLFEADRRTPSGPEDRFACHNHRRPPSARRSRHPDSLTQIATLVPPQVRERHCLSKAPTDGAQGR
jgi:hypothetical protein